MSSVIDSLEPNVAYAELNEVCKSILDCPHSTPVWTDSGVLVLRSQNIRDGKLNLAQKSFTDENHYEQRIRRAAPAAGDLVITREAPMGEVCMIPPDLKCCLGQRMVLLRPNPEKADGRFLLYALQSPGVQHAIRAHEGTGSTVSNLRIPALSALKVPTPSMTTQRAVAHILGTLDDKIELNRRMNETLEAMAKALFKSWFVDFDPVRAKAEGRKPTGMDEETAALFPSEFVDSELGKIPKGWELVTLGEACESIFSGGTPATGDASYWGGEVPWLSSGETRNAFIIDAEKRITQAGITNSSTRFARAGCTVIASAGQGHTRGQTSLLACDTYVNQSVVALTAHQKLSSDMFLFFDLSRRYDEFRQLSDSHSSRGSLTTKLLAGVDQVLPPSVLVKAFDRIVEPTVKRIVFNLRLSIRLASLRDALLPMLMSGKIEV